MRTSRMLLSFAILSVGLTACSRVERRWKSGEPFAVNGEYLPPAPLKIEKEQPVIPIGVQDNREFLEGRDAAQWSGTNERTPLSPERPARSGERTQLLEIQSVYFDRNSDSLRPEMAQTLIQVAAYLQRNPQQLLEIRGSVESPGAEAYKYHLANRRAELVRSFLVDLGVAADRVFAVSYGSDANLDKKDIKLDYAANPRCDFYVF